METNTEKPIRLPDDLVGALDELAMKYGESRIRLIIAAVDHFTRIPEQQRLAVIKGSGIRRRGF